MFECTPIYIYVYTEYAYSVYTSRYIRLYACLYGHISTVVASSPNSIFCLSHPLARSRALSSLNAIEAVLVSLKSLSAQRRLLCRPCLSFLFLEMPNNGGIGPPPTLAQPVLHQGAKQLFGPWHDMFVQQSQTETFILKKKPTFATRLL